MNLKPPRPFAFAVDDLGWNEGGDLSAEPLQGPHRAGVKRSFDARDYRAIVNVARKVGARVQCLFILSEMDRSNLLARFPTTTYQRGEWNNSHRVSNTQHEIMNLVKAEAAWMEFGLHGTGHEYWAQGQEQKRAEWYNLKDKQPWPEQSLRDHLQCFSAIMAQYGITKANGHSFPESFVPCAYSYYWNPHGSYSLGKLLSEAGVRFANTDFSQIPELNPPAGINGGGFDFGVHVINRLNFGNPWYQLDCLPSIAIEHQQTDIVESHWPNWLAQDDFLQAGVTQKWIDYYHAVQHSPDRYIAKNTEQLHSQWLYNVYARLTQTSPGIIEIDNTSMPDEVFRTFSPGNLVLKIKLEPGKHISVASINDSPLACYFEEAGFGFIYLPPLRRAKYTVRYQIGPHPMPVHVYNDGTYNAYGLEITPESISINMRMYGTQHLKLRCAKPANIISESPALRIVGDKYDQETSLFDVEVSGADMQGSAGSIKITW